MRSLLTQAPIMSRSGSPLQDEFVTIELDNRGGETLVFSRKEMVAATDEILTDNGVRAQGSPDTMAVWQARAQ
jgi:hypothetical protein